MPDSYEEWYKQQIDNGKLPDENGYFHYCLSEEPEEEQGEGE